MSFDIEKNYEVYFKNQLLGRFDKAHYGIGWISGMHWKAEHVFKTILDFCQAYEEYVDETNHIFTLDDIQHKEDPAEVHFILSELDALIKRFGEDYLKLQNWKIIDAAYPDEILNHTIPLISETSVTWKGKM